MIDERTRQRTDQTTSWPIKSPSRKAHQIETKNKNNMLAVSPTHPSFWSLLIVVSTCAEESTYRHRFSHYLSWLIGMPKFSKWSRWVGFTSQCDRHVGLTYISCWMEWDMPNLRGFETLRTCGSVKKIYINI